MIYIYMYFYETMMFNLTIVGRYFPYYGSRIPIDDPCRPPKLVQCMRSARRGVLSAEGCL